mmetsp:Transcript_90991/g.253289  ORF Transcript_90991/g.253289 Transcript_90991/m.253289 type:complete len:317 (-) Transcript_90991:559-1509(-)
MLSRGWCLHNLQASCTAPVTHVAQEVHDCDAVAVQGIHDANCSRSPQWCNTRRLHGHAHRGTWTDVIHGLISADVRFVHLEAQVEVTFVVQVSVWIPKAHGHAAPLVADHHADALSVQPVASQHAQSRVAMHLHHVTRLQREVLGAGLHVQHEPPQIAHLLRTVCAKDVHSHAVDRVTDDPAPGGAAGMPAAAVAVLLAPLDAGAWARQPLHSGSQHQVRAGQPDTPLSGEVHCCGWALHRAHPAQVARQQARWQATMVNGSSEDHDTPREDTRKVVLKLCRGLLPRCQAVSQDIQFCQLCLLLGGGLAQPLQFCP